MIYYFFYNNNKKKDTFIFGNNTCLIFSKKKKYKYELINNKLVLYYNNIVRNFISYDNGITFIYYNMTLIASNKKKLLHIENELNNNSVVDRSTIVKQNNSNVVDRSTIVKQNNSNIVNRSTIVKQNNDKIYLIYYGILQDEYNILEIIDEFQKIHKKRPDILLKIVYNKIIGNNEFINKINNYVKQGVKGIIFKHNLSYKDACYEIEKSDIGICWHKNGWSDSINVNIKEYKLYNLPIIDEKNMFSIFLKKTVYIIRYNKKSSGYFQRTLHILNERNDFLGIYNPFLKNIKINKFDKYDNTIILYLTQNKFFKIIKFLNIETIILPSNHLNFQSIYNFFNKKNIKKPKFIYELRGLWFLTHHSNMQYKNNKKINFSKFTLNELEHEHNAIRNADSLIFINNSIRNYLINKLKMHEILSKPYILLYNSYALKTLNIIKKEPNKIYTVGYFGSIYHYEGIELLAQVCNLINKKYNRIYIRLVLYGSINKQYYNFDYKKYNFIEYNEFIPHEEYIKKIQEIDLLCIPRLNYKVCEIVPALKPLAAMAYKIPILISDHPCYREMAGDGFYYFKPENKQSLQENLEKIMKITDHSVKTNHNYNLVIDKYNWENQCNKINNLLSEKYDFKLPERNDNEIRLVYYGDLRDEENTLEIIEEFQKIHKERPEVVLKIVYGEIYGNPEFTQKVNHYIKQGVKGITFKHNLSHKDACYEIATSDIGICWRKNGEVNTKVKEYQLYGLEIINDMKVKVGVVTSTNKLDKIDNIIRNFKNQLYFNKKLFLVINNNDINIEYIKNQLINNKINYELIIIDKKYNLGYCLNNAINEMKKQKYDIFSKFDDDDIYEEKYLLEQVFHLNKNKNYIIGKYNIPLFIPEYNNFYTSKNITKNNQLYKFCRGSTITFNINNIKHNFDTENKQGVDSIFLKKYLKNNGKIYVTSFSNYIWIRYLDKNKHTWKLDINKYNLKIIDDTQLIYNLYSSLINYKLIDVSHLLTTIIITMYNSSKTIEKCLQSMLNQTHKNVEIIVVDDASNDNSIELVEKYIKKNNNIKLIKNKENRGTYYCKNMALKNMNKNTKYIAFQDSDDLSHKERIRKQIEILYLTNGKLSVTLCKRYDILRFACISQVYDIEIFNKLGYFDNSRFGADTLQIQKILNYYEKSKIFGRYTYENIFKIFQKFKKSFLVPHCLYIINSNDQNCLTNINKLYSNKRLIYSFLDKKTNISIKLLENTSLINYIPINYNIEYTINSINNNIITVKKENFKILNSILIIFELKNINIDMNVIVNIYEDNNIFENKLTIYKENNKCYSYILIDNPDKILSFDIHIDNYKNVKKIKLKNIDYIYYYNNITNKFFLNDFPYKDNNLKLNKKQIIDFKFLTLKYDKYFLNSRVIKKLNTDIIDIPNLELNILGENPLVSIIITCYNSKNTIEMSINSLLNQTYKNIEIIIVDDCSHDTSRNIINKFKDKDNIKIIFNKKNNKTYSSRNIALQYCSGDFITFQDADDISLYDRIEKQVTYSIKNKCHINIGLCLRTNILNKLNLNETKSNMFDKIINNIDTSKFNNYNCFKNQFILPISKIPHIGLVTSFIHKSVFNDIGNFAILPCSGDIEFIERFLCKKYNLIFNESRFVNLSTLLSNIKNIGSIHIMKETIYIAMQTDNNLTSKYDKNFRSELKQRYRKEYEKDNKKIKYITISENLFV